MPTDPGIFDDRFSPFGLTRCCATRTFQVIRRTIATLAQKKGTVKDVQGLLRHSRPATTTDVYMQEIPESVQATVNAINAELRVKPEETHAG
jgi:integrase